VFACGVCIFIMATGMPPWRQANLGDPHFAWVHQCGISQLVKAWKKAMPPAADELMAVMVQSDPAKRPSSEQCLSHSWFAELSRQPVPVHHMVDTDAMSVPSMLHPELQRPCATHLAGDPYREEAVVRSTAAPQPPSSIATPFAGVLAGDFYNLPEDDVWRSAGPTPEQLTLQRFSAGDMPPKAPKNESFAFESPLSVQSAKNRLSLQTICWIFSPWLAGPW